MNEDAVPAVGSTDPRLAAIEERALEDRAAGYGELLDELQSALAAADEPQRA